MTHAVKDPKRGVISCWVCFFALIVMDVVRILLLGSKNTLYNWIFGILIAIWLVISVVETIKMIKKKKKG